MSDVCKGVPVPGTVSVMDPELRALLVQLWIDVKTWRDNRRELCPRPGTHEETLLAIGQEFSVAGLWLKRIAEELGAESMRYLRAAALERSEAELDAAISVLIDGPDGDEEGASPAPPDVQNGGREPVFFRPG